MAELWATGPLRSPSQTASGQALDIGRYALVGVLVMLITALMLKPVWHGTSPGVAGSLEQQVR